MLRSSRIPPLLSRICGDGITTALLVTTDGELLGSSTNLANQRHNALPLVGGTTTTTTTSSSSTGQDYNPQQGIDMESVGALIAEVTGDYRRAGNELLLLNLENHMYGNNNNNNNNNNNTASHHNKQRRRQPQQQQRRQPPPPPRSGADGRPQQDGASSSSSSSSSPTGSSSNNNNNNDGNNGNNHTPGDTMFLLLEMELGLIGVAGAGPNCLLIAIAERQNVEHGFVKARTVALAAHIRDALSQLNHSAQA